MDLKVQKTVTETVYVAPCIKCGHDDINIRDYGYNASNIGGGTCKRCKHEVSSACDIFPEMEKLAAIWNAENCKNTIITRKKQQIANLEAEIAELVG